MSNVVMGLIIMFVVPLPWVSFPSRDRESGLGVSGYPCDWESGLGVSGYVTTC